MTAKCLPDAQQQIKIQQKVYTLHLKKKAYSMKLASADSTVFSTTLNSYKQNKFMLGM